MPDAKSPQAELMSIFDFTADDLLANRRGQMTKRQIQKLRSSLVDVSFGSISLVIIFGAVFAVGLLARTVELHPEVMRFINSAVCVGAIVVPLFMISIIVYSLTTLTDLRQRSVRSFMSDFSLVSYRNRRNFIKHYELRTSGKVYTLTKQQFDRLRPIHIHHGKNAPYRFYLAENSDKLLSMELIPE